MKAIIIHQEHDGNGIITTGGIYDGITEKAARESVSKFNNTLVFYIPLTVSGKTYQERKADLYNKALEYSSSWYNFCGFSYGELATISDFFETNGKRYGLFKEFQENGIC